ncbi:peptidase [candidate division KSB1 bacterium]|nr:peptidase [candidate division KSB1 bacterium]
MKKQYLIKSMLLSGLLLFSLFAVHCPDDDDSQTLSLGDRLRALPGVEVEKISPPTDYKQAYQIDLIQPLDHDNPAGPTFTQRFYLSHVDYKAPMLFYTSGYGVSRNSITELAKLFRCNQIQLVHRYFPNAEPDPLDWQYLTIRQAAADQHRIYELLKGIYQEYWFNAGSSKGGMTALFYRRFHPNDMRVTVAYVAPIMDRTEDPRFAPFFEQVGTTDCHDKIHAFQREVLSRRQSIMPLLTQYAQTNNYTFSIISAEEAFEYSVVEYQFAFWQYGSESDCADIPEVTASDAALFDHLISVSPLYFYEDDGFVYVQPLFYQAYTEIGYCPYVYNHLQDLLQAVPEPRYRAFAPVGAELVFKPEVMPDVINYLQNEGERIIYIYGAIDPWSAAALAPSPGLDAVFCLQPGANHTIKISGLSQKGQVLEALQRWLNIDLTPDRLDVFPPQEERRRM